jgi:uncharacterized protein (DUF934 family)
MSEPKPLLPPVKPPVVERRIYKGGRLIDDTWQVLDDAAPIPIEGRAILSLARWRAEQATLTHGVPFGVLVQPAEALEAATDDLYRLEVIALAFPKYTDGRAYSTARRLRDQHGYKGEIRATGDVLIDQIPLMLRAGFDSFEVVHAPTIAALERGVIPAVSRVYQAATERAPAHWLSRRAVSG